MNGSDPINIDKVTNSGNVKLDVGQVTNSGSEQLDIGQVTNTANVKLDVGQVTDSGNVKLEIPPSINESIASPTIMTNLKTGLGQFASQLKSKSNPSDLVNALKRVGKGGGIGGIVGLNKTIWAIFSLTLAVILVYVIYKSLRKGYFRPFLPGHTEPFEKYMESYMKDFIDHCNVLLKSSDSSAKTVIKQFADMYKEVSETDLFNADIGKYTPDTLPHMYMIIMFHKAIQKDDKEELSLVRKFFNRDVVEKYFVQRENIEKPQTVSVDAFSQIKQLEILFDEVRKVIHSDATLFKSRDVADTDTSTDVIISTYILDLMINHYFDQIHDNILRSYNLRKSGGRGWILFKLYMEEYNTYIFKETIPDIWKTLGSDTKTTAKRYQEAVASEKAQNFVRNLPFVIAGVDEGFANNLSDPGVTTGPNGETREHFIQALNAIAKTFTALYKLVISVVQVISDPINFIRWLLGLIIGFIIYLLYLVLIAMSFIFIIPAFIVILGLKLAFTIVWTAVYLLVAVVYLILQMLDKPTNGLIFKMLRCENLPNAWHLKPGFAKDNIFQRKFFCQYTCGKRYFPSGYKCEKLPQYEPSYCPHQLIFNAYDKRYSELQSNPFIHQYKPTIDYYLKKTDAARKAIWSDVYENRHEFMQQCSEKMAPYNHVTHKMCHVLADDEKFKKSNPDEYEKIMSLCDLTYCKNDADKSKFCKHTSDTSNDKNKHDIITTVTFKFIVLILCIIFVSGAMNLVRV
jgi:hypothetical protein